MKVLSVSSQRFSAQMSSDKSVQNLNMTLSTLVKYLTQISN